MHNVVVSLANTLLVVVTDCHSFLRINFHGNTIDTHIGDKIQFPAGLESSQKNKGGL
ncbi:hypothetical protein K8T06_07745 [bacterium]|nr:hypothetical protein [bacterium]